MNFTWAGSIGIRGGSPKLSNNIMHLQTDDAGILAGGLVTNNTIVYNGYRAIVVGDSPIIGFNTIDGKLQTGVHVTGGVSATIFGNLIKNTTYLGYGYESNSGGFVFGGGWLGYPVVVNNTIVNCNHGLTFPPYSVEGLDRTDFEFNNVYSTGYAVEVGKTDPRITIALPHNWWGTNDSAVIDQLIYDQNDDRSLCLINYTGFLNMPAPFPLDSTPPVTLQNYDGLWHTQNFNITFQATDNLCGVWNTFYRVNNGIINNVRSNGVPQITAEGSNSSLEYWSIDNAGNEENHHILAGIKLDKTAPAGSILINDGDAFTSSTSVFLSLTASDVTSGVSQVRFSNDGIWDTEQWELYTPAKAWTLSVGDGKKTVYFQIKDNAGVFSTPYSDAITLDTSPPIFPIVQINDNGAYTNFTDLSLTLYAFDEGSGMSQMCFSNDNNVWSSWEPYATQKFWSLEAGDGVKSVFVQYKDLVGITVTASDNITLDMTLPVANAGQNQIVQVGQSVKFNGNGSTDNSGIASYFWNFGDGTTGSDVAPTHNYTSVGNYTVTLMVKDVAGNSAASSSTVKVEVVVPEFPPAVMLMMLVFGTALAFALGKKWKTQFVNARVSSTEHPKQKSKTWPT